MAVLLTPQFIGVTTVSAHVRRAIDFTNQPEVYAALGKTSAWPDDNNPPDPDPEATAILEPIGYKKVSKNVLVVPDVAGDIEVYGITWREVAEVDAYTEKARHVWIQAAFNYDEFPTNVSYRQIGLFSNLVRESTDLIANPGRTALLPVHVTDPGVLEYIYNDKPIPRAVNRRDIVNLIITF
jgi:hypothetical protein